MLVSLLVMPLSPSILCSIPPSVDMLIPVLVLMLSSRSCSYWVIVKSIHELC